MKTRGLDTAREEEKPLPNKFAKGVPCLSVKDCPAAILYYCDVLGFQKDFDDVDQLCDEFRARGVKIVLPPQDEPWGERHMAIEDLEGHQLNFSSRIGAAR